MRFPLYEPIPVPQLPAFGAFGVRRKHDVHTGVDLAAPVGTPVLAVEDGIVAILGPFTGAEAGCPWWLPTDAVLVEGDSGVILYGEIEPMVERWEAVEEGQVIGRVLRVLRTDKGYPTSMLHLELYAAGYRGPGEVWALDAPQPAPLRDPTPLLTGILDAQHRQERGVSCPRCRAIMSSKAQLARHKQVCTRRPEAERERNERVRRLRERGVFLPPPEACPVCGQRPELVTGTTLYCNRPDLAWKLFWRCPAGCAHVGCHEGTSVPLGDLATEEVRQARMRAHAAFDRLWGAGGCMPRSRAYVELAQHLGLSREACHIGRFSVEMCERVIAACAEIGVDKREQDL
jgi:hypothetical protein